MTSTKQALEDHAAYVARVNETAARLAALHRRRYPAAYIPEDSTTEGDRVRALSRSTSTSGILPTFGAARDRIAETVRRYDVDDRTSRDLDRAADAILRDAGDTVVAVDVVDTFTRMPTVRPDRAAYRGKVRYQRPSIHKSERNAGLVQVPSNTNLIERLRSGRLTIDKVRTRVKSPVRFFEVDGTGTALLVTLLRTEITVSDDRKVTFIGCDAPPAWRGHRRTVIPRPGAIDKSDGTTPRKVGRPAGSVWVIGESSVRTRWNRVTKTDAAVGERLAAERDAVRSALIAGDTVAVSGASVRMSFDHAATAKVTDRSACVVETFNVDGSVSASATFTLGDVVRRVALARVGAAIRDSSGD